MAQSAWWFFLFVIFSLILTSFYPDIWIYLRFHPFPIKMAELFLLAKCQWTANANIYNIIMQLWYKTIIKIPCYFFFACYYHIHKIFFFIPVVGVKTTECFCCKAWGHATSVIHDRSRFDTLSGEWRVSEFDQS